MNTSTSVPTPSYPTPLAASVRSYFLLRAQGPAAFPPTWQGALCDPVVGFLQRPGKELRSTLMQAIYAAVGGTGHCPAACVQIIEALHAGSLIVDDIEDDSQTRRGAPALHLQIGVPAALNAGNWLYFWAMDQLCDLALSPERHVSLFKATARVLARCHEGQALDLAARVFELEQAEVANLVATTTTLKTGALLSLAARLATESAAASLDTIRRMEQLGAELGTALQMLDDLSALLNPERWNKGEEDLVLGRTTWPWAWIANCESRTAFKKLQQLAEKAHRDPRLVETLAQKLRVALRGSGRMHIRRQLHKARSTIESVPLTPQGLDSLFQELKRLERSYG